MRSTSALLLAHGPGWGPLRCRVAAERALVRALGRRRRRPRRRRPRPEPAPAPWPPAPSSPARSGGTGGRSRSRGPRRSCLPAPGRTPGPRSPPPTARPRGGPGSSPSDGGQRRQRPLGGPPEHGDQGPPGVGGKPAAGAPGGRGDEPAEEPLELRLVGHVEQLGRQLDPRDTAGGSPMAGSAGGAPRTRGWAPSRRKPGRAGSCMTPPGRAGTAYAPDHCKKRAIPGWRESGGRGAQRKEAAANPRRARCLATVRRAIG